jgi:D-sedoheptulose 7-phosphate isomerase
MMDPGQALDKFVADSHQTQARFFTQNQESIIKLSGTVAGRLREGGKILFFGNGGSAADAQHMAAEFVGRFIPDRPALPAMSLSTDTSILTALGNDYGYDQIFARQIEAHGRSGDVAFGISTSGNSANVLAGIGAARQAGLYTVGFTGEGGGKMTGQVDVLFSVPSRITPRIQETHILLGHSLCELIDRNLFPDAYPDMPR